MPGRQMFATIVLAVLMPVGSFASCSDAVTVLYNPQNPTDSCVRVFSLRGQSFWAGFLLVLAIVVLVFEMARTRRNRVTCGWR